MRTHKEELKEKPPNIVVGTPGRVLDLARQGNLNLKTVRHFVLDECDKMLESLGRSVLGVQGRGREGEVAGEGSGWKGEAQGMQGWNKGKRDRQYLCPLVRGI